MLRVSASRTLAALACVGCVWLTPGCIPMSLTPGPETQTHRGEIDDTYPPGSPRPSGMGTGARFVATASVEGDDDPFVIGAVEAIRRDAVGEPVGFDLLERTETKVDDDFSYRRTVCDYVFFDASQRVVRAYRRYERC